MKLRSIATIAVFLLIGPILSAQAQSNGSDFFAAVKSGDVSRLMAVLSDQHPDLELRDARGDTALLMAARQNDLKIVELLTKRGANINAMDAKRRDVLNIAISNKNPELARLALNLGSDPTLVTSVYDGAAVIYGSAKGEVEIIQMLVKAGAPVNRVNNLGWTALLEVAILGDGTEPYVEIAKVLTQAGADRAVEDKDGKTAFDHAVARGHTALAKVLNPSQDLPRDSAADKVDAQ